MELFMMFDGLDCTGAIPRGTFSINAKFLVERAFAYQDCRY